MDPVDGEVTPRRLGGADELAAQPATDSMKSKLIATFGVLSVSALLLRAKLDENKRRQSEAAGNAGGAPRLEFSDSLVKSLQKLKPLP